MSVNNRQCTLRNIAEERISQFHRGGSQKCVKYLPHMPHRYGNDALKYYSIPYSDNTVHLRTPEKLCGSWARDVMVLNDVTRTDCKRHRPSSKRGV